MASDSSGGFFSFPTRNIAQFFTDKQDTTERVEEKNEQTNTDLGQLQAQEVSMWHFLYILCFCELMRACTRAKLSQKPLAMRTSSCVGQPGLCRSTGLSSRLFDFCWLSSLSCFHLLAVSFCRLCPSLDSYLKLTVLFCLPLSTPLSVFSGTFLPSFTSDLTGVLTLRPFVWVSHQNRQGDSLTGTNTNRNESYLLCHIPLRSS